MKTSEKLALVGVSNLFAVVSVILLVVAKTATTGWKILLLVAGTALCLLSVGFLFLCLVHTYWDIIERLKKRN